MADNSKVSNPYYTYGILYLSPNFKEWEAAKGKRYEEYRRAWVERIASFEAGDFPLNINVEVTSRCNLACTFCTQSSLRPDQLGDLPFEIYTKVMAEAAEYHLPAANLNGLGEPLLTRHLPEMIAFAKQKGLVDVMFHTNATIMTEKIAKDLIEAGLDKIIFSMDSPEKETYESMRINAKFENALKNIRLFAKVRESLGRKTPTIRLTMVVTDRNAHQVKDFVKLWQPIADQITLQDLTWRTKLLDNGEWSNKEKSAIPMDMEEIRQKAREHKLSFVCPALFQSAWLFWNSDIIPCSNPNARQHMVMGNVKNATLKQVWDGEPYRELRKLHLEGRWEEHPVCKDCEVPMVELYKALQSRNVVFGATEENNRQLVSPLAIPVVSEKSQDVTSGEDIVNRIKREKGMA